MKKEHIVTCFNITKYTYIQKGRHHSLLCTHLPSHNPFSLYHFQIQVLHTDDTIHVPCCELLIPVTPTAPFIHYMFVLIKTISNIVSVYVIFLGNSDRIGRARTSTPLDVTVNRPFSLMQIYFLELPHLLDCLGEILSGNLDAIWSPCLCSQRLLTVQFTSFLEPFCKS